jgi:4-carboxymuconolactone decarboxylase
MGRLSTILTTNFSEAQQELFESITGGKRSEGRPPDAWLNGEGGMAGPFNALLYSPLFGQAVQRLGEVVRFENSMPPELRELAILLVAAKWQAQYEWWAHEKIARREGLAEPIIAAIKAGRLPDFTRPDEAVVYHFAQELLNQQQVSEPRYGAAVELLGEAGLVELVILLGYYTLVSMSLNVFQVPLPEGEPLPFAGTT